MKYIPYIISLILGIAFYLFWSIPCRGILNYHEELQLFLIDGDYFLEHLKACGGLSVYLSEALVQFFNNYRIGAAIVTIELLLIQWLSWQCLLIIFRKYNERYPLYIYLISYIPMCVTWLLMGDVEIMHSLVIAVLLAVLTLWLILILIQSRSGRFLALFLCLPIYYWSTWTNHLRSPNGEISWGQIYAKDICTVLDYDFLVRSNKWQEIIDKSRKGMIDSPIVISATNLSLAMKNQLGESAPDFMQHGTQGLLPHYSRLPLQLFTMAEIYFQLGLINTSQRFYFEGMEAIPNYNKSSRSIRRLAEISLINKQYRAARKYLHLLQKTLFYKNWATRTLEMIDAGEETIFRHPLYGRLRNVKLDEDFFFSEAQVDQILGDLFFTNSDNRIALQYYLLYPILEKDVVKFMKHYNVAKDILPNNAQVEAFHNYIQKE